MDVRQVRPTDAPLVLALALDESSHLVRSSHWPTANPVVRTVAQSLLPLALPGRAWLARDGGNIGLLQAQPRQYVIGWDITRLAVRGDAGAVLPALLEAITCFLQSRGVPRLFARCREEESPALESVEFVPLTREYLLSGPEEPSAEDAPLPIDSRYRMPQDAWPLHQLEREITPSMIAQVEGLTSLDWSQKMSGTTEIVVERNGQIVAWVGCGKRPLQGVIPVGLLVHPEFKELGPHLLRHVLQRGVPRYPFLARVREYQVETLNTFLDAGFHILSEEILMVKHARVEFARAAKARPRVASVPTIQVFNIDVVGAGSCLLTGTGTRIDEEVES